MLFRSVAVMRGPQVFCLTRSGIARAGEDPKQPLAEGVLADRAAVDSTDLRLLTIDPKSLEGPFPDDSVRPGGVACRVKAWSAGKWYPVEAPDLSLTLVEFPHPDGEAIYFQVPDPNAAPLVDDE